MSLFPWQKGRRVLRRSCEMAVSTLNNCLWVRLRWLDLVFVAPLSEELARRFSGKRQADQG